jgi:hypothetical protein
VSFSQVRATLDGAHGALSGAPLDGKPHPAPCVFVLGDDAASCCPATAVSNLALREGSAHVLGLADDPRVVKHFAEQRERIAQTRALLPAELAREGLSVPLWQK